ncbi:MAG: tripartite tricarboxylate transporter substrate binding protein, partial [Burkholderiaceae bacterium]|nr:tripartite tricarboxylate transporter substrate binding protein [Burkholderiaceae bacterium]
MTLIRRTAILACLATLASASAVAQTAAEWPAKTLRIVVPYPPGGSSDIIARSISQVLSESLKQTVIVENKPGANGNLGADFVTKAEP